MALWIYWQAIVLMWKGVRYAPRRGATSGGAEGGHQPLRGSEDESLGRVTWPMWRVAPGWERAGRYYDPPPVVASQEEAVRRYQEMQKGTGQGRARGGVRTEQGAAVGCPFTWRPARRWPWRHDE